MAPDQGCAGVRIPVRESGTRDIPEISPVRFGNPGVCFHLENGYFLNKKTEFSIWDKKNIIVKKLSSAIVPID